MMPMEPDEQQSMSNEEVEDGGTITIDFGSLYKFKPEDMIIDINSTFYTNHAFTQVMNRDVYIDFLQIPGVKKDGLMHVNGVRIYLTHAHAKKLAKSLLGVLDNVHKGGKMESYEDE